MRPSALKVGDRIWCHTEYDCYPHFVAPKGFATVTYLEEIPPAKDVVVWARWDDLIPGCEEWNNEVCFYPERPIWDYCDVVTGEEK